MDDSGAVLLAGEPGAGLGVSPPGGMGVTSQGFGQEGYVLRSDDIGVRPRPSPEAQNFTVGVPYYLPFATPYRDSWEVFRQDPVTISQLVSMRRQDGQARALYRLLTMPLLAAMKNADVIPVDGQLGGTAEAQFCKDLLFQPSSAGGMTHSWHKFILQMLLALFNGFSAWEMIPWTAPDGPNKGKITLRQLGWRPAETLTFLLDGQGEFNGFRQRTFFQGRTIDVKIPKDTAIYYAHEEAERPFYGVSMFESAFYHYDKKVKLYYIAHLAAQRAAVGLRVGTMPPSPAAADKNNFIRALADLGLAQYIALPSADWMVQSLKEEGNFDFLGLINHHNSEMSKSILAQWFDQSQGGGQGDSSLVDFGKSDTSTFMMMLDGILEEMAEIISNRIFPRFVDWNFGSGKYPEFKWGPLTGEQKAALQDTFDKLSIAGQQANVTPQFMLELEKKMAGDLGFDIDYDTIEKEQEAQRKMQMQQQKMQMQQQMQQGQAGTSAGSSAGAGAGAGAAGPASGATMNTPSNLLPSGFQPKAA